MAGVVVCGVVTDGMAQRQHVLGQIGAGPHRLRDAQLQRQIAGYHRQLATQCTYEQPAVYTLQR